MQIIAPTYIHVVYTYLFQLCLTMVCLLGGLDFYYMLSLCLYPSHWCIVLRRSFFYWHTILRKKSEQINKSINQRTLFVKSGFVKLYINRKNFDVIRYINDLDTDINWARDKSPTLPAGTPWSNNVEIKMYKQRWQHEYNVVLTFDHDMSTE